MKKRIVIFGDSITQGHADLESSGWATRLKIDFMSKDISSVYPLGISADATDNLLERFDVEARSRTPHIVIYAIGTNDSLYFKNGDVYMDTDLFKSNLLELVRQARKYTKDIICVGLTPVIDSMLQPLPYSTRGSCYSTERIELFDNLIQDVCKKEELKYIPMYDVIDQSELPDGLHPNSIGHKKMFERIRDFLVENVLNVK